MEYSPSHSRNRSSHAAHDDWDNVHSQLIEVQRKQQVQKKSLEISDPQDSDEQEADEIARKVTGGESAQVHGSGGTINRKGEGSAETTPEFHSSLEQSKGSGQSLPGNVQQEMGSKMGADLSGVKIHTGSEAHAMSESINAKAFTHGQDIYFHGSHSPQNKELLAHELVHTVQQTDKISRAIGDDYVIKDKYQFSENEGNKIYFALGESEPDEDEKGKLRKEAMMPVPELDVTGYASEEGDLKFNKTLALKRANTVKKYLELYGYTGKINAIEKAEAGLYDMQYREKRVVEIRIPSSPGSVADCGSMNATETCTKDEDDVYKKALARANELIDNAKTKLRNLNAPDDKALFVKIFKDEKNATIVSDNLDKVKAHLKQTETNHFRGTSCNTTCQGAYAYNSGTDATAQMVLCDVFFNSTLDEQAGTLFHESTHGTGGLKSASGKADINGTNDLAYSFQRLILYLTADEALNNADSYEAYLHLATDPYSMTLGPQRPDTMINLNSTETDTMNLDIAELETGLQKMALIAGFAYEELKDVFQAKQPFDGTEVILMKGMGFDLKSDISSPQREDMIKIAGIQDRVNMMLLEVAYPLTVEKVVAPESYWVISGGKSKFFANEDFFKMNADDQRENILRYLIKATPAEMKQTVEAYVELRRLAKKWYIH